MYKYNTMRGGKRLKPGQPGYKEPRKKIGKETKSSEQVISEPKEPMSTAECEAKCIERWIKHVNNRLYLVKLSKNAASYSEKRQAEREIAFVDAKLVIIERSPFFIPADATLALQNQVKPNDAPPDFVLGEIKRKNRLPTFSANIKKKQETLIAKPRITKDLTIAQKWWKDRIAANPKKKKKRKAPLTVNETRQALRMWREQPRMQHALIKADSVNMERSGGKKKNTINRKD